MSSGEGGDDRRARSDVAVKWWTRLDAGGLSAEESRAFAAWLTETEANRAAFEEVVRLWGDLESLRSQLPARAAPVRRLHWRRAAAVAAAISALAIFSDDIALLLEATERTGVGETKVIALADGSRAQLSANSAIAVDFNARERRLRLLDGEVWFDVAPDPARPFTVQAGGGVITALGTAFDVATDKMRTEVTVGEHRVRISGRGPNVIVEEGRQSAFGPGLAAAPAYPVNVNDVTAWRRGKLIFEDRPLGEVIAALGRYHRGYLLVFDNSVRERRVSGVFEASDPIGALRTIERSLGLNALFLSDYLVVLRG